jgi:excinuclease ABC subunit B
VNYIHSNVHSLERPEILRDLRLGIYDVLVGVNLLREGLDLPEVTLVAILDADKEGFLRSETSLIQTIGRAARNVDGKVIMYADNITGSMERAIDETNRRRAIQVQYNIDNGTEPVTINKEVRETIRSYDQVNEIAAQYSSETQKAVLDGSPVRVEDIPILIASMEKEMKDLAKAMEFEKAAHVRDEIESLRKIAGTSDGRLGQEKRKVRRFASRK